MKLSDSQQEKAYFVVLCVALFLVFFRPIEAMRLDGWNPDSACYADWLYRFFGSGFERCKYNYYYPGAPMLWFPSACLGYFLAWLTSMSPALWIEPLVGLTTFSLFLGAIWVNIKSFRILSPSNISTPILISLAAPVLPYAGIHTFLSHSAEFLFASLAIHALLRKNLRGVVLWGALSTLTRPTGILVFLAVAGFLLDDHLKHRAASMVLQRRNRALLILCGCAALAVGLRIVFRGYGNTTDEGNYTLFSGVMADMSFAQVWRFLAGDRNGMLLTGHWWLLVFVSGIFSLRRLSWAARGCIAWMTILCLLCVGWGSNGSQDGWFILYRYLTATYAGIILLYHELRAVLPNVLSRVLNIALWTQASVVCYLSFMNNFPIPRVWDVILRASSFNETVWKHLTLIAYMPVPVALFSWLPGLSEKIYGGKHFVAGPSLWLLTLAIVVATILLARAASRAARLSSSESH